LQLEEDELEEQLEEEEQHEEEEELEQQLEEELEQCFRRRRHFLDFLDFFIFPLQPQLSPQISSSQHFLMQTSPHDEP